MSYTNRSKLIMLRNYYKAQLIEVGNLRFKVRVFSLHDNTTHRDFVGPTEEEAINKAFEHYLGGVSA